MLADFASPQGMQGPSNVTPSRRGTFEEDFFPASSRSFSSPLGLAGVSKAPLNVSSPATRPPTIYDQINDWFRVVIGKRQTKTSLWSAGLASFVLTIALLVLKFSFWSPFSSIYAIITSTMSLSTYLFAFVSVVCFAIASYTMMHLLNKVDQLRRVSLLRADSWIVFSLLLAVNIVTSFTLLTLTDSSHRFGLNATLLGFGIVCATLVTVFGIDHQLTFSGNAAQLSFLKTFTSMFSLGGETVLSHAVAQCSRIMAYTAVAGVVLGPIFYGFSSVLFLFDVSFHLTMAVLVLSQLFIGRALNKLTRFIVMQPIAFLLPPPYVVHSPTPEQTRNLVNVLESQDRMLKLFAFFDLRRIAWGDVKRRADIFSLSQPGGHPRNWAAVSGACLRTLEHTRTQIEQATASFVGCTEEDEEDEQMDREMLMMPHKARTQLYSSAVRKRHRVAMRPMAGRKNAAPKITWWNKLSSLLSDEVFTVSRYDAQVAILAIESLYMLVVESYTEDRYGVVLKDLTTIVREFLALITTNDKFFRTKATVANATSSDVTIHQMDAAIQSAMLRINNKFGQHLRSLDLSPTEMQTIKMMNLADN